MRITVFHGTKKSFVQAVINSEDFPAFKKLGFVDSADKLKGAKNDNKKG